MCVAQACVMCIRRRQCSGSNRLYTVQRDDGRFAFFVLLLSIDFCRCSWNFRRYLVCRLTLFFPSFVATYKSVMGKLVTMVMAATKTTTTTAMNKNEMMAKGKWICGNWGRDNLNCLRYQQHDTMELTHMRWHSNRHQHLLSVSHCLHNGKINACQVSQPFCHTHMKWFFSHFAQTVAASQSMSPTNRKLISRDHHAQVLYVYWTAFLLSNHIFRLRVASRSMSIYATFNRRTFRI